MGVRYDYFGDPSAADVRRYMDENDASSPVPATFDGIELKTIDPSAALGMLIAFVTDKKWSVGLVR